MAIQYALEIHQMAYKYTSAYLNAPIDCELYVEHPRGFK